MLEVARKFDVEKFIQISTDEVYGSIENGSFKEADILNPSSPYSASKAGSDLLVNAYYKTYGIPVLTTRSSNNYGPFQFPEKLIPVLIINALKNKTLPIYATGKNVRDWIHVLDNCRAINLVSKKGKFGEIFNIGSGNEKTNLEIANIILEELNKPKTLIEFVKDRPGHDFRYSLNWGKIKKMGWEPRISLVEGLKKTIEWYIKNGWWWEPLIKSL